MILYDVVAHPAGVTDTLSHVVIDGPVPTLSIWPVVPVLRLTCGEDRMLHGEHKGTACGEAVGDLPADGIETLDIMERQRTDDNIEGICWKANIFDCSPAV